MLPAMCSQRCNVCVHAYVPASPRVPLQWIVTLPEPCSTSIACMLLRIGEDVCLLGELGQPALRSTARVDKLGKLNCCIPVHCMSWWRTGLTGVRTRMPALQHVTFHILRSVAGPPSWQVGLPLGALYR